MWSGFNKVDLAVEEQKEVVCKLSALLCFRIFEAALIPYVLVAVLNLPHP